MRPVYASSQYALVTIMQPNIGWTTVVIGDFSPKKSTNMVLLHWKKSMNQYLR